MTKSPLLSLIFVYYAIIFWGVNFVFFFSAQRCMPFQVSSYFLKSLIIRCVLFWHIQYEYYQLFNNIGLANFFLVARFFLACQGFLIVEHTLQRDDFLYLVYYFKRQVTYCTCLSCREMYCAVRKTGLTLQINSNVTLPICTFHLASLNKSLSYLS